MSASPLVVFPVVVTTVVAFLVRVLVVRMTRLRWPSVAAAVERWWVWTPLVVVCALGIWLMPPIGVAATIGMLIALTRSGAVGSPFRPRR